MTDVGRHPNIDILAYSEIKALEGEEGDFRITLTRKPRYVKSELCTGCRTCALDCPVHVPNPFNQNLSTTKAIHVLFPQAVPAVSTIEKEHCLFLEQKKCKICFPICKHQAIDFTQTEEEVTVNVGAVIVTTGYDIFDSILAAEYGYGRIKNVLNSLELERLLNADGPTRGELFRPSDGKIPKKIAWLQCVGSRNPRLGHSYCSGVCCAYAIKQLMIIKSHYPDAQTVIFHNDIRTYGKGIEDLYNRAQRMEGVRFIRRNISLIKENRKSKDILISFISDDHKVQEEEFDMLVLSVGLSPAKDNKSLTQTLGLHLNQQGFGKSHLLSPNETIRPGVYSAATFVSPMDIPDSISSVTGAVSLASQLLSTQRGTLVEPRSFPEERSIGGEEVRIGVFVCHCGSNIARVVDVPSVVQYASSLRNVVHSEEQTFSCSFDSGKHLSEVIREKSLNRVVVAACTPRTHEPLFRETLREGGINPYLLEIANIREHCSWVHSLEKEKATQKAKDLVAMSVARSEHLYPLKEIEVPVIKKGLVLGGGLAGMKAALALARQGLEVFLVEKEQELGGNLKNLYYTLEGIEVQPFLERLKRDVQDEKHITIFQGYELRSFSGFVGNFKSILESCIPGRRDDQIRLEHGILIVATGGKLKEPTQYRYGESQKIVTQQELEGMIGSNSPVKDLKQVAMIQCVGARNEERPYCGRICCGEAVKNALKIKELNKDTEVFVFYRDMRTYGFYEDYYTRAREKGVLFIQYDSGKEPEIHTKGEDLSLSYYDPVLNMQGEIRPDLVVLSTPVLSDGSDQLGQLLRIPVTKDGFFMEAHLKLRPLDFSSEGIFLCGLAHYPKFIPETISQANGAAARAASILLREKVVSSGAVSEILEEECTGCGLCQKVCPYGAIEIQERSKCKKAWIIPPLCKGCGACISRCPARAISQHHFTDSQILSQIHAAYCVPIKRSEPKIIAFLCNWCGYAAADLAGVSKFQFPSNIRVIRVMCSARVSSNFIMEAFSREIDGVLVVGCRVEDCHYISGIYETMKIIPSTQKALEKIGIDPGRLRLEHTSAAEATKFVEVVSNFTSMVTQLGPLELNEEQKEGLRKAIQKKEKKKGKAEVGDSSEN